MKKSEVLTELREREQSLGRWRSRGMGLQVPRHDCMYLEEFWAWVREARNGHPVLAWGAQELARVAHEYLRRDYNAYYCRLRRWHNALARWELAGKCPVRQPTRYSIAANAAYQQMEAAHD